MRPSAGPGRLREQRLPPGSILGHSVLRVEDGPLVTGVARFLDDVATEGALHVAFVRSWRPHATIRAVDAAEAMAVPGVVEVVTAADVGPLAMNEAEGVPAVFARPLLADGVVRFVGEPVAAVVADTLGAAVDGAELVSVDYDPLPALIDPLAALEPGAPILFPQAATNVVLEWDVADDPGALEGADVIVRARLVNQRVAPVPMEPNGALAVPEPATGGLTLFVPCQAPHMVRDSAARILELPQERVRVAAPAVGGGFGARIPVYAEQLVVAALALRLGRPVRHVETRSESMIVLTHGRAQVQDVELGARRDGTIVGLRVRVVGDAGAYPNEGATLPPLTGLMASGPYRIDRIDFHASAVVTNTTPVGAYRGAGRPEATWFLERCMDLLAAELEMDPVEVRRRNLIPPDAFPHETPTGASYDTGAYEAALDEALRLAGYDDLRKEQAVRRERDDPVQLGVGICCYVEVSGWGSEFGSVEVHDDGTLTVLTGTSPQGQGHETAFAQLVAGTLGVPLGSIRVIHSDTARVPRGEGTMGSRSLQVGGSAVLGAAGVVLDRARHVAAHLLEVSPEDVIAFDDGRVGVAGAPATALTWAELAAAANDADRLPPGMDRGLAAHHDFEAEDSTYSFGTHVAVVEVDTETGDARLVRHVAVDDCGTILNPLLVEGQIHGGVAQGAAQALFEHMLYDDIGNPLTTNLATYSMPSAAELPTYETGHTTTPTTRNPLGAKGVGESGTIGSGPAVHNAVIDAVAHLGVRDLRLPCTPERVWRAIRDAREHPPEGGGDR